MIGRIIRLPIKLIAMPAALALFLCHAACAIVIGIGSMVTNLVSGLFIFRCRHRVDCRCSIGYGVSMPWLGPVSFGSTAPCQLDHREKPPICCIGCLASSQPDLSPSFITHFVTQPLLRRRLFHSHKHKERST